MEHNGMLYEPQDIEIIGGEEEEVIVRIRKRYIRDSLNPFDFKKRYRFSKASMMDGILPGIEEGLLKGNNRGLPVTPVFQLLACLRFYATASFQENKPLYSFEDNGDYVYDVAWSPVHPALFAAVDGMGRLDLWSLNQDTEVPTASATVEGGPALNHISWTPAGDHVTVGDDFGKIWVYDVGEQLAQPRHDEWTKLVYTLQELKNNQADEEIDKLSFSSGASSSLSSLSALR